MGLFSKSNANTRAQSARAYKGGKQVNAKVAARVAADAQRKADFKTAKAKAKAAQSAKAKAAQSAKAKAAKNTGSAR